MVGAGTKRPSQTVSGEVACAVHSHRGGEGVGVSGGVLGGAQCPVATLFLLER